MAQVKHNLFRLGLQVVRELLVPYASKRQKLSHLLLQSDKPFPKLCERLRSQHSFPTHEAPIHSLNFCRTSDIYVKREQNRLLHESLASSTDLIGPLSLLLMMRCRIFLSLSFRRGIIIFGRRNCYSFGSCAAPFRFRVQGEGLLMILVEACDIIVIDSDNDGVVIHHSLLI